MLALGAGVRDFEYLIDFIGGCLALDTADEAGAVEFFVGDRAGFVRWLFSWFWWAEPAVGLWGRGEVGFLFSRGFETLRCGVGVDAGCIIVAVLTVIALDTGDDILVVGWVRVGFGLVC